MSTTEVKEKTISRQRRYQLRQKQAGKCIICAKQAVNATYCEFHRLMACEWARRAYVKKQA